ncbi:MAG: DinB family protein [Dehalococcoidia bacterium]|nr:DinB family protein [Dehalococcoidia bacterium]
MSSKAEEMATRFEQASDDMASTVQALSDDEWRAQTKEEGWTVAACAHHAATSTGPIAMMIAAAAGKGDMPDITVDMLHQMNADHARQFAGCSKEETLAALRETTGPAASVVRGLSDDELQRTATLPLGMEMTAEQIIENVLIGHLQQHGASIAAAVPA